jgi:hypothetical protein
LAKLRRTAYNRSTTRGIVHHQHQRARYVSRNTTQRDGRTCRCEHQSHDQQCPEQQQQPVLQLEPSLVLARGTDEIAYGGKNDGRRFAPGEQVE